MDKKGTGLSVVSVTGNRSVEVDGCDGIVDYSDEKVIVKTGKLTVEITGRNLKLKRLTESSACVEGIIGKLEYIY